MSQATRYTAVSFLCVFALLFTAGKTAGAANPVYIILASVLLLLVPSYLAQFPLKNSLFSVNGVLEKTLAFSVIAFANAVALFLVPALSGYVFGLSIKNVFYLYMAFLAAANIAALFLIKDRQFSPKLKDKEDSGVVLLFWALMLTTVWLSLHYGNWLSGDYTWHGSYIRKLCELPNIAFRHYIVADVQYPLFGYNVWHMFYALLVFITGLDTAVVWVNSSFIINFIKTAVFFFILREALRSNYWAYAGTIVFLVVHSLLGIDVGGDLVTLEHKWSWDTAGYPSVVSRDIFMYLIVYLVFKSVNNRKYYFLEVIALSLCMAFVHFYYQLQLLFILGIVYIASFFTVNDDAKFYRGTVLRYLGAMLPAMLYTFWYIKIINSPVVNPWHMNTAGMGDLRDRVKLLFGKFPYIHIWGGYLRNIYFAVMTLLFIPLLLTFKKYAFSLAKLYAVAIPLVIALIYFNPPLLYFMRHFNPSLDRVWRTIEVMPVIFIAAVFLYNAVEERHFFTRKTLSALLYASLIFIIPLSVKYHKDIVYTSGLWNKNSQNNTAMKQMVRRYVPDGSLAAVDPKIAWTWTTLFNHYIIMHPLPAGLPPSYDPGPLMKAWKDFFEKPLTRDSVDAMKASGMEYIITTGGGYESRRGEYNGFNADFEKPSFINEMGLAVIKIKKGNS